MTRKALLLVHTNVASAEQEQEFNDWYDKVHIPQLLERIPHAAPGQQNEDEGEQDAWRERLARERVVAHGERLAEASEDHLLTGDQAR